MFIIVDKQQDSIMRFGDVEVGEFFKYHNSVYLKISYLNSNTTNAFDLSESESSIFCEDDLVQAINATLTVEPW